MSKFFVAFSIPNGDEIETDGEDLEEELDDWLLNHELVYTKTDQVLLEWISCQRCDPELKVNLLEAPVYAGELHRSLTCPNCDEVNHQ